MIEPSLLNELANHVNTRIAKVVLNKTYEITEFTVKKVSESIVSLEYMIPIGSVDSVSLIELRAADGAVLTSNAVYIPLTTDTIIKQPITVKEVA
ncbi:hypothetical protein [Paenibacillus sp. OSY-SE]|uniref:hypothetical protein n=1 Tax=Paenibacillus sp. OSY-SE TaxID=1196323 RepID=UPI0002DB2482|nr:hypothetical protein [Paenibacillus sp. OSY-SE]